jgi:hypothetical protein
MDMPNEPTKPANKFAVRNPLGEWVCLISGEESEAELRSLIVQIVMKFPQVEAHPHCPFHMLSGLSYTSMSTTVNALSRAACLGLFEMERDCRAVCAAACPNTKKLAS